MADEVDAQFGLDSVVKEVLANATVMDSTPGPVNVSGEEGWTSMSLLYIDPNGDLFLKEQQNQPVTWDGTSITIGATNGDYITIDTTAIKFFKDSDTEKGSLSGDTWTLGTSTAYHTSITNTAVQLKNGSTVLTEIAGGNATFGEVAADKGNVHILAGTPAKIQLRNNTSVLAQLSSSTLTLGATTAEHISISGVNVQFYNAGTVKGSLSTDTWTLGTTGNNHVLITDSAVNLKNSSVVLASLTGSALTLGATTAEHIVISGSDIVFKADASTTKGSLNGNTWTLGTSTAYHTEITDTAISVKSDASTTLTSITGGNITLGLTSAEYAKISGVGFQFFDGGNERFRLDVANNKLAFYGDGEEEFFDIFQDGGSSIPVVRLDATALGATSGLIEVKSDNNAQLWLLGDDDGGGSGRSEIILASGGSRGWYYFDPSNASHGQAFRGPTSGQETITRTWYPNSRYRMVTITPENITSGTKYTEYFDDVATSNNTPVTVRTIASSANVTYHVQVWATARQTAGGALDDAGAFFHVSLFRQKSGTLAIAASSNLYTLRDDSGWVVTTAVSSNDMLIKVTGDAADATDWTIHTRIYETST